MHSPIPNDPRIYVSVIFGVGSSQETAKHSGISHFLEHMMFRGSKNYPSFESLANAFEWLGGEWNASTSYEYTEYSYYGSYKNLEAIVKLFRDFIHNPLLLDEEKERQVILREIEDETNELGFSTDLNYHMSKLFWPHTTKAMPIAGTSNSVKGLGKEDLEKHRSLYYTPNNLCISVVGGNQNKSILDLLEGSFSQYSPSKKPSQEAKPQTTSLFQGPRVKWVENSDNQFQVQLSFLCEGEWSKKSLYYEVISYILSDGFFSRLPFKLREELGLVYDIESNLCQFKDCGSFDILASVHSEHTLGFTAELCLVLSNLLENGFTNTEVEKAKVRAIYDLELLPFNPEEYAFRLGWHSLNNQNPDIDLEIKKLESITPSLLNTIAQELFTKTNCALVLFGPELDKVEDEALKAINNTLP